jgi:hypothetical protein
VGKGAGTGTDSEGERWPSPASPASISKPVRGRRRSSGIDRKNTGSQRAGLPTCRSNIAPVSHVSAGLAHATAQANRGKPARHCEAYLPAGERHGGRASRGRGRRGNEGPGGATAGDDRKMNNEPLERKPIDRVRARLEALLKANAAPRCGARSKRTGKPCRGAAMPNGRCKFHGGKSTGPRTPEGLARSRRANWKHGHFSREAKAERSRVRAAILALRDLCDSI